MADLTEAGKVAKLVLVRAMVSDAERLLEQAGRVAQEVRELEVCAELDALRLELFDALRSVQRRVKAVSR